MLSEMDMKILEQQKTLVGKWLISLGKNSDYAIPTYYKPKIVHRFFMRLCFGIVWQEIHHPY